MAAPGIARRGRWNPGARSAIDWSHPLAVNLVGFAVPFGGKAYDLVQRVWADDVSGTHTGTVSPFGNGATITTSSAARQRFSGDRCGSASNASVVLVCRRDSGVTGGMRAGSWGGGADARILIDVAHSTGAVTPGVRSGSGGYGIPSSPATIPDKTWTTIATTWDGATVSGYAPGAAPTTASASTAWAGSGAAAFGVGTSEANNWGGEWAFVGLWQRTLSHGEINALHADPFQMLRW